jgi:type I restriction enzyme M protein
LWFLDKSKATPSPQPSPSGRGRNAAEGEGKQNRADTVLFIDARHIYRQVDRAHRDWTQAQIGFIANLVRLYRGEAPDLTVGGEETAAKLKEVFGHPSTSHPLPLGEGRGEGAKLGRGAGGEGAGKVAYRDIPGLCKAATLAEIEAQGWSLNPGRYVGVAPGEEVSDEDFKTQLETLNEELEKLNAQARELEQTIAANVAGILEA